MWLNVELNDNREKKLDAIVDESKYSGHGAISDCVRDLIDSEFKRQGLDVDTVKTGDETTVVDEYDVNNYSGELSEDEIRELIDAGVQKINPRHVPYDGVPQGLAVQTVTAMSRVRFGNVDKDTVDKIRKLCREAGLVSEYYLTSTGNGINVPKQVYMLIESESESGDGIASEYDMLTGEIVEQIESRMCKEDDLRKSYKLLFDIDLPDELSEWTDTASRILEIDDMDDETIINWYKQGVAIQEMCDDMTMVYESDFDTDEVEFSEVMSEFGERVGDKVEF